MPEKNYLVHYGIKGMKWGKRRFQNEDGSLTPAGVRRYSDDAGSSSTRAVPNSPYKSSAKGQGGASSVSDTLRRERKSGPRTSWVDDKNSSIGRSERSAFDSAKGKSRIDSKGISSVSKETPKNAPGESGGRDEYKPKSISTPQRGGRQYASYVSRRRNTQFTNDFGNYMPITGVSLYSGGSNKSSNDKDKGKHTIHVTKAGPTSQYASTRQRMDYYRENGHPSTEKRPYGTNDTASALQRKEKKSNQKKTPDQMTDKEWDQFENNFRKAITQETKEKHPNWVSDYNPSARNHQLRGVTSIGNRPYGENTERSGQGEYFNKARVNNNADAWEKSRKETQQRQKPQSNKSSSITTRAKQTISQASQQASKSIEKASDWLKKLLGKK